MQNWGTHEGDRNHKQPQRQQLFLPDTPICNSVAVWFSLLWHCKEGRNYCVSQFEGAVHQGMGQEFEVSGYVSSSRETETDECGPLSPFQLVPNPSPWDDDVHIRVFPPQWNLSGNLDMLRGVFQNNSKSGQSVCDRGWPSQTNAHTPCM